MSLGRRGRVPRRRVGLGGIKSFMKGKRVDRETSDSILSQLAGSDELIDPKEFHEGINVELEHLGTTKGNPLKTGQIALDHLREFPDYYTRLEIMEDKAKRAFRRHKNRGLIVPKETDTLAKDYDEKAKEYFEATGTYAEGEAQDVD